MFRRENEMEHFWSDTLSLSELPLNVKTDFKPKKSDVLPPTRNGNPFGSNEAISGPINLVSGSNCSLGSYRLEDISTMV